ncbi:MAG: ABC transporter ATP-binding protein [Limnochordia bacterium]
MPSVSVRNLTVAYNKGRTLALDNLNLDIRDGEFCVFLGPSGCGKTTALLCIAGLLVPTSGSIKIGDQVVISDDKKTFVRPQERNIAMVFQEYALYPSMTVRGNMAFALENKKYPREEIDRKVNSIANMLGIEQLLDRKPAQLSGGQRQRVALGRALVRDPSLFLLDEPLGNLDAKLREQVRFELKRIQRQLGVTTIYVTHDQTEAMTLADRIVLMKDGKVMQQGSPKDLYNRPINTFVAGFVGTPKINFLECGVTAKENRPYFNFGRSSLPGSPSLKAKLSGKACVIGIRPSDFALADMSNPEAIKGTVELIEPMGDEILVHFMVENHLLVGKFDAADEDRVCERVAVKVDPEKLHVFDGKTGDRIA